MFLQTPKELMQKTLTKRVKNKMKQEISDRCSQEKQNAIYNKWVLEVATQEYKGNIKLMLAGLKRGA